MKRHLASASALLAATGALTLAGTGSAQAVTAPDVTDLSVARNVAADGFTDIAFNIVLDVDPADEVSKIEGHLIVDGEDLGYQRFSVSDDDYTNAILYWDTGDLGIGDAKIVDTRITYYPNGGSPQVIVDETQSNTFRVRQESSVYGSVAHYTDGSLLIQAHGTYYSAAKDETVDLAGQKVAVYRFINGKPKKITFITLDKSGDGDKKLRGQGRAKYVYGLSFAGTSEIAPSAVKGNSKV